MSQIPLAVLDAFRDLGLTEKQLAVVETLYVFGQSKVHDITHQTKPRIPRSEVYNVLERLVDHKLVHLHKINNVAYYELKSNADIIRWAKKKYIAAEKKYHKSQKAVDEIKKFLTTRTHRALKTPSFHHFHNAKGIRLAHSAILKRMYNVDMYLDYEVVTDICSDYVTQLHTILNECSDLKIRCILPMNTPQEILDMLQHSQLFLRVKSVDVAPPNPLVYAGETWMINFSMEDKELDGLYIALPDKNGMKIVLDAFEKDWQQAEPIA